MDMSLLSVSRAPCVPFSSRPKQKSGQYYRSKQVVRCSAQPEDDSQRSNDLASNLGKVVAPFAAAVLLLAQSQPAFAETPYESSMRVQKEFQNSGSRLDRFLNKGTPSTEVVSDSSGVKAAIDGPFSSPVETAKGALDEAKQAAAQAAPSRGGFLGLFDKANAPKAGEVKGVVGDAASSVKDALPDVGSPGQVAGKAKEAASQVADAAPRGGGFFGGLFNRAPKPSEVKGAASDAASSAKNALPDSAPTSGQVASSAKDAANKVADAAPSKDNFLGGILNNAPDSGDVKGAVSDATSAAKDALPNSAPSPSQVASGAKDAADKVADAAPSKNSFLGGIFNNAPDGGDVKGAVGDATSAAKDALPDSAPNPSQVASGAKDAADKAADAAPSKGFLGNLFNNAPDTGDVKGAVSDAASSAKDALPDSAPNPSQVASGAKDAADKVADAAPSKSFLGNLFNNAPDASDVKGAVGDAASSAKDALPDSAPNPSQVASGAKDAADKVADAAPNKGFLAGLFNKAPDAGDVKGAVSDAASSAKDALPDSAANPSQVASGAKDAARSVANAAPSPGEAVDSAKQGLKDASLTPNSPREALASAKDTAKDVVGSAQDEAEVVGTGNKTPSGPGLFSKAKDNVSALPSGGDAGDAVKNSVEKFAPDSDAMPGGGIFGSLLGGPTPEPAKTPSNQLEAPPPSSLEEPVPENAEKLPPQPYPEAEDAIPAGSSGRDSAGSKFGETVEDTSSGGGILDSYGGSPSGKSQEQKKDDLVEKAKQPNPQKNFLGNFFSSSEGNPFDNLLGGSSALPVNEVGSVAALPAPQPSDLDERGNLPQKTPGEEIKLPPQPKPEPAAPEQLGKDSAGGKTQDSKNGGGILDFFGGSTGKDSSQKAAENVDKASALPQSSEIGQIAEASPEAVVEAVSENKPDGGKATLIGLAFAIALEILIFTVQPKPEGKKAH